LAARRDALHSCLWRLLFLDGTSAGNHLDDHEWASFVTVYLSRARRACFSGLDRRTVVRQLPVLAAIRRSRGIGRRQRTAPKQKSGAQRP